MFKDCDLLQSLTEISFDDQINLEYVLSDAMPLPDLSIEHLPIIK